MRRLSLSLVDAPLPVGCRSVSDSDRSGLVDGRPAAVPAVATVVIDVEPTPR